MSKRTLAVGAAAGVVGTVLLGIATYKSFARHDRRSRTRRLLEAVRTPAETVRRVVPVG